MYMNYIENEFRADKYHHFLRPIIDSCLIVN